MAKKAGKSPKIIQQPIDAQEKIARLLGLLLVKDLETMVDQVGMLRRAGFQVGEVADMLGITENHANVASNKARKKPRRKLTGAPK
jgi:hypothetical protein